MIPGLTVQRILRVILTHWVGQVSIGILFFAMAFLFFDLPAQVSRGEKGQLAIQALDAMRRPFLAIKQIEAEAMGNAKPDLIKREFEDAAAIGYAALASYRSSTQYNNQLTMKVAALAQQYDAWITEERNTLELLASSTDTAKPTLSKHLREAMSRASIHFLRTMDVLGNGEHPIHADIDRGRRATHITLLLSGILLLYFAAILFYHQFRKTRDLQLQVTERSAHLVEINKALAQEVELRKRAEEEMRNQAVHDTLTGLPNRRLFLDRLGQAMARAPWRRKLSVVLFVDLDEFKQINDTMGHTSGDEVLRIVAGRLCDCTRAGDTVARFGGDEFTIVLVDVHKKEDVYRIAQKIVNEVGKPFVLGSREVCVTCSIGISMHPGDGENAETLLKFSDIAMYSAKCKGKNCWQFYAELAAPETET